MLVKLNERLLAISAFIKDNEKVIDIGCDHGLLGIYLYQNRLNIRIVSSDINKNPLAIAKSNLEKYGLENKIELRQGDGLNCLDDNTKTIIISGMGGLTVIGILASIKKYPYVEKLVLSPNNDLPLIRKSITKLGFDISKETMVKENNKYYVVSCYEKSSKKDKINYLFGKLDKNNDLVQEYFRDLYQKNKELLKTIPKKKILKRYQLQKTNLQIFRFINNI